ncbi:MAG: Gfo/Idh/MocA family oxidoreductase [Vicingaceae bacterium]
MIKLGVLGAGHLGKIHIQQAKEVENIELTGFYDINDENAQSVENQYHIKRFTDIDALIEASDAIDIVTPTLSHYDCAVSALKKARHIFIEKPVTNTVEEAKKLLDIAAEANVKVQVGHVERFNPAFKAAKPYFNQPMFIETHRLAQFNPRGTDVPVVLDLMIHDIDIVLSVVNSNIKNIYASGVAVVSDTPDIANARIEFDNGCVANLTSSRISLKNMRKSRFFQKDAYISVDFLEKKTEIVRMSNIEGTPDPLSMTIDLGNGKGMKEIFFENPKIEPSNAIREELQTFSEAILQNSNPLVSLHDGYKALQVATQIVEKLKFSTSFVEE